MNREIKFRVWDNTPTNDGFKGVMLNDEYVINSDYLIDGINGRYPIMQYTGLKDKNGKEIYEGDILDNETQVIFSKEQACFFAGTVPLCMSNSHREIIGNIHENPELL